MIQRNAAVCLASFMCLGLAVGAVQAGRLSMNGQTVSNSVRTIDGAAYVRLSDVARAFDMQVVKHGTSYELVKAGGANGVTGTNGKIGTEFFTGKWRFLVSDVQTMSTYTPKYSGDSPFDADTGQELIAVTCRLKNGTKETQTLYFARSAPGNTALADSDGHSFGARAVDAHNGIPTVDDVLPGAAKDFVVVFEVPQGTKPKDLIYTISGPDARIGSTDVRVSLTQ